MTDSSRAGPFRSVAAYARDAALFAACYVGLDWASYIYPLGPFNITPWNPPPALCIVWMLLGGLRFVPVVFAAILLGDLLVRHMPGGWALCAVTSFILAAGYSGIVIAFRKARFNGTLRETRDLITFVAVIVAGTAAIAALYVGTLYFAGHYIADRLVRATFQFWLGQVVGILVTAPLLLVVTAPLGRNRLARAWREPATTLQFAALTTLLFIMFARTNDPQAYFYLLFLPLIWIAFRSGLAGAVVAAAITQIGVVLGAQGGALRSLEVVELQALVSAFTLTGLALGIVVDERERAVEEAKRSLRMAAASEMAGAIAHEINQPLAALHNYGSACLDILDCSENYARHGELNTIVQKMQTESRRAADVVKRLRDLFRSGAMQLELVRVDTLVKSACAIGDKLNAEGEVDFRIANQAGARTLLVDRVQIEVVLRNLLANAFDAVGGLPAAKKEVSVAVRALANGDVAFCIRDSGAGLPPSVRQRLFEPFVTEKESGMGIGLSICRTIAEAHGGSLRAGETLHGEFELVLPGKEAHE